MRIHRARAHAAALTAVLLAAIWLAGGHAFAADTLYMENQWNYVDGSMDVSHGIPEDATGRLAKIREAGRLTVATEPYFPPQEFIDATKSGQAQYIGADIELARRIAERMGVELEIVPLEFVEVQNAVAEGQYDLAISALAFTATRAAVLEMSKGYYYTHEPVSSGVLIRADRADEIASVADLEDRSIVAQSGSLQETMAVESILYYHQFRRLSTLVEVYAAVMSGGADAAVVDIETARAYIAGHPDCGLALLPDVYFSLQPQYQGDRVAAQKGELELIYFVNGVIDEVLTSGQYEAWYAQYS
jgi:polar amino acid transport system substrate-binding protein